MAAVDWIELVPKKKSESAEITQKIELEFFEKQIEEKDFVVLLDNNGKMLSSEQLTQQFQNIAAAAVKDVAAKAMKDGPKPSKKRAATGKARKSTDQGSVTQGPPPRSAPRRWPARW